MSSDTKTEQVLNAALVDDEAWAVTALRQLLQVYCPTIRIIASASTMTAAMAIARSGEADIIFVDIELPGGSGFEVAEAAQARGTAVIFISAHSRQTEAFTRFPKAGFLTKPVCIEELKAAVVSVTERRRESARP